MRQIVLDTETTGLDPRQGHRVIEIAALEVVDRRPTGRYLHFYLNPEREIDTAATEVHGMTWDDLRDKPRFRDVVGELCDFLRGSEWVIHNAPFDIAFLDMEFRLCDLPACKQMHARVVDTLALAREQFPGKRNSLDALCERFGVDNAERTLHGALLDTRLLADIYLAMTRGQESLTIDMAPHADARAGAVAVALARPRGPLLVLPPTAGELAAHAAYLESLDKESKGRCIWLSLGQVAEAAA